MKITTATTTTTATTATGGCFPIWPQGEAPGAAGSGALPHSEDLGAGLGYADRAVSGIRTPEITVWPVAEPNGCGLLIMPGGGYWRVMVDREGSVLAPALNAKGYTLFVMTYRMPGDGHQEQADAPLADAQRAIRTLRARAAEWGMDAQRIGVLGFSAGGHLAAALGTRHHLSLAAPQDEWDRLSARPDFMVLLYPVISMQHPIAHSGSRQRLLGDRPDATAIAHYSLENAVNADTPPTLLIHAIDDPSVPVENSLVMLASLRKQQIPVEAHLFELGQHGFGIRGAQGLPARIWPTLMDNWIQQLPAPAVG